MQITQNEKCAGPECSCRAIADGDNPNSLDVCKRARNELNELEHIQPNKMKRFRNTCKVYRRIGPFAADTMVTRVRVCVSVRANVNYVIYMWLRAPYMLTALTTAGDETTHDTIGAHQMRHRDARCG